MLSSNALTTLEQVKNDLGIASDVTSDDAYLAQLINSVSQTIETYCRTRFGLQEYHEMKQGRGSTKLILDNYPIHKVNQVIINEEVVNIDGIKTIPDNGIILRPIGGFPSKVYGDYFMHPGPDDGQFNIFVEYTAGYVLPKDATDENPRSLPYDIETACIRMVRIMKMDRDESMKGNLVLKRETIGDWIGEYEKDKTIKQRVDHLDADILGVLDLYRRSEVLT